MKLETATGRERRKGRCRLQKKCCENDIPKGDKLLLKRERANLLSTPFKQEPFTVVQENGNSVLVEADGLTCPGHVTHVKRYLVSENQRLGHTKTTFEHLSFVICHLSFVHTTAKQVISRRRKNENNFKISKDEKCTCKACKGIVFHCQICKWSFCCRRGCLKC